MRNNANKNIQIQQTKEANEETTEQKEMERRVQIYFSWMNTVFNTVIKYDDEKKVYYLDPHFMFILREIKLTPDNFEFVNVSLEEMINCIKTEIQNRNIYTNKVTDLAAKIDSIFGSFTPAQLAEVMSGNIKIQKQETNKTNKSSAEVSRKSLFDYSVKQ